MAADVAVVDADGAAVAGAAVVDDDEGLKLGSFG